MDTKILHDPRYLMPGNFGTIVYVGVVLKVLVKEGPLGIHFLKRGS